ncbi:MAG TPA: AI-2E family transporter [Candidatus Limnocylindria bacterium]|nr:AI-2E family transporter [Candidatus Limnocylindria bacterium]
MQADMRPFASRVLLVAGVALAALALLAFVWYAGNILLTIFAGLLLAVGLGGLADWTVSRTGLRRGVALAIVVVVVLGVIVAGGAVIGATATAQVRELLATLPEAIENFKATLDRTAVGRFVLERIPDNTASGDTAPRTPWWALALTLDVVTGLVLTGFIALFVAADPQLYARGVVRLLPQSRRRRVRQVLGELDTRMRRWLLGKLVTMVITAAVTWAGLALIGVPLALALGILAGLFNFIPYVGPLIAFVPAMLLALMQGGLGTVGAVAGLWVGVQTLEGYILTPLIDQEAVDIPPALQLSALAVAGTAMGTMGIVLGAPLTAVIFVLVQRLYVEDALGDDIDEPMDEPRVRAA